MKKVKSLIFLFLILLILLSSFNVSNAGLIKTLINRLKSRVTSNDKIVQIQKDTIIKGANADKSFLQNNEISIELLNKYTYEKGESGIQGSCTDGEYIYIATITKDSKPYTKQETKILIINLKTRQIVKRVKLGRIGHSNAMTYNPKNKTIIISTCSPIKNYVYQISTKELLNSNNIKLSKIYLKDRENKRLSKKNNISSISYNLGRNEYCVIWSNNRIVVFDENFKMKRIIQLNKELNAENITGQSIYCDSSYIYYVCNNIKNGIHNTVNYVKVYDYNGKIIRNAIIRNTGAEFESLFSYKGVYYVVSNSVEQQDGKNRYYIKIHKLNLRNNTNYEVSFVDENKENLDASVTNQTTKYQTMAYGNSTKIMNTGFKKEAKKLVGYRIYRDYDQKWRIEIDGESKWLSLEQINEYRKQGKSVSFDLFKESAVFKNATIAGDSVLLTAVWE